MRYNADSSVLLSGSYDKTVRAWAMRSVKIRAIAGATLCVHPTELLTRVCGCALAVRARNSYMPIQVLDDFRDSVTSMVVAEHEIIAGYRHFRLVRTRPFQRLHSCGLLSRLQVC